MNAGAGCSEKLQSLHVEDTQIMTGHGAWAIHSRWPYLRKGFGFPDVPSSLDCSLTLGDLSQTIVHDVSKSIT